MQSQRGAPGGHQIAEISPRADSLQGSCWCQRTACSQSDRGCCSLACRNVAVHAMVHGAPFCTRPSSLPSRHVHLPITLAVLHGLETKECCLQLQPAADSGPAVCLQHSHGVTCSSSRQAGALCSAVRPSWEGPLRSCRSSLPCSSRSPRPSSPARERWHSEPPGCQQAAGSTSCTATHHVPEGRDVLRPPVLVLQVVSAVALSRQCSAETRYSHRARPRDARVLPDVQAQDGDARCSRVAELHHKQAVINHLLAPAAAAADHKQAAPAGCPGWLCRRRPACRLPG